MNNPKVSVLMPAYNTEKYIGEAIESILNQTYTDFEFIIIDDYSTDNTWNIIQEYAKKDKRIKAYKNEKNLGIVGSRNKLMDLGIGEYFAWQDSDDISFNNRLEKQVNFLEQNKDYGLCGTNFNVIDKNGNFLYEIIEPETDEQIRKTFFIKNPFNQSSTLIRSCSIKQVGYYDSNFKVAEDLDYWIRFGVKYKIYNLQDFLCSYRIHGINSIKTKANLMLKNTNKLRKKMRILGYQSDFKGNIICLISSIAVYIPGLSKYIIQPPRWITRILGNKN